jgi:hypothetical protein
MRRKKKREPSAPDTPPEKRDDEETRDPLRRTDARLLRQLIYIVEQVFLAVGVVAAMVLVGAVVVRLLRNKWVRLLLMLVGSNVAVQLLIRWRASEPDEVADPYTAPSHHSASAS